MLASGFLLKHVTFVLTYLTWLWNRYILNFLRNGELLCPKETLWSLKDQLLAEARLYQLERLVDLLSPLPKVFSESSIIASRNQENTLLSWIPKLQGRHWCITSNTRECVENVRISDTEKRVEKCRVAELVGRNSRIWLSWWNTLVYICSTRFGIIRGK